ncbi:MAG TPA: carotenoid biosynthesis protein [Blastocatellia bacterium]|jgi:putative membrane protein|nr:carotenoid biosynthesis protein [Blastocatellia bacterium]
MIHFLELLISTIAYRPYVFIFFACYLFLAITHIGWRRAALFTVVAYAVALLCEWSSAVAATGFPFGLYYYIDRTSQRELWIAGVPFMDSLSFTFLSYVSWEMATILLGRLKASWSDVQVMNGGETRNRWATAALAAFLMMYLDIIIDPVALRGDRWFLGKIYYYPGGGSYFGITLANFLGWYFVCFVIVRLFVSLEKIIFAKAPSFKGGGYRYKALGPAGLYFGVLGFNLFMTFWIGERELGVVGVIIVLPLFVMIALALGKSATETQRHRES